MRRFSGQALARKRQESKMSQDRVCERFQETSGQRLYKARLSEYERGRHVPCVDIAAHLADVIGCNVTDFLEES